MPVEVIINPTSQPIVADSGATAPAGTYRLAVTPVTGATRVLAGPLPQVPNGLYPSTSWTDANGIPRQLAFGWVGSTGSLTEFHEIDDAVVSTVSTVPQLTVATTSYNGASPQPGDPVNYTVTAGVGSGAGVAQPISVTQTVPVNVVPVGAFGSGWVCAAPVGRSITCTNGNGPFSGGSSLPPITVVAIVTGTGVTPALIQSTSPSSSAAADAAPGYTNTTTAGTVPATPTSLALSPTSGPTSGGGAVTVTGTNLANATAIEIGTTAEQRAGTPVVLLP
ncbi:IPT/TIG domain-containing protein, partial [Frankia sp. EI5c]|uniref:IPT/TIG domain-containing protein n=1 Tax=Frankia sp. EI5c TaxID=683316 RepID=UPI001F5B40C5